MTWTAHHIGLKLLWFSQFIYSYIQFKFHHQLFLRVCQRSTVLLFYWHCWRCCIFPFVSFGVIKFIPERQNGSHILWNWNKIIQLMFGGIFSILFTVHRRHNMYSFSFVCVLFFRVLIYKTEIRIFVTRCIFAMSSASASMCYKYFRPRKLWLLCSHIIGRHVPNEKYNAIASG